MEKGRLIGGPPQRRGGMCMNITEVRIFLRDEAKLRAYATVTFDNCFVVHNMRIIDGKNGLFVAMPSRKKKDGTHQDIAHPIATEMRQKLEEAVLAEYRKVTAAAVETGEKNGSEMPSGFMPEPEEPQKTI